MSSRLPLFPLSKPLFPGSLLPLQLFEERYLRLWRENFGNEPLFGVVLTKTGREVADQPEVHSIGTGATLIAMINHPDMPLQIAVRGGRTFRVLSLDWSKSYLVGDIEWIEDPVDESPELESLAKRALAAYKAFTSLVLTGLNVEPRSDPLPDAPLPLSYALAARLPANPWEEQVLLELPTASTRLLRLIELIGRERTLIQNGAATGRPIDHPGRRFSPN